METKAKKYRDILQERKADTVVDGKTTVEWETELSRFDKKMLKFESFKAYIKSTNKMNKKLLLFYRVLLKVVPVT